MIEELRAEREQIEGAILVIEHSRAVAVKGRVARAEAFGFADLEQQVRATR
jgi:hypothetical protein